MATGTQDAQRRTTGTTRAPTNHPGPGEKNCEIQISYIRNLIGRGMYVKIKSLGGVLSGSLSAVSKPNFARKYSLESS